MILLADSGSTKIDWALVSDKGEVLTTLQTEGITPVHQTEEQMLCILTEATSHLSPLTFHLSSLTFYGSGIIPAKKSLMERVLRRAFPQIEKVHAHNDLLAAARALCGHVEGIACILGTGANSCLYDGQYIVQNTPPLGYVVGDEGSGAALGKLFFNAMFKGRLPDSLREDYLQYARLTYSDVIDRIYRQPMANRFLASTSLYICRHLDCLPLRQLVVDNFRQFVRLNLTPYQRADLPVKAIGSMAWHYREQLLEAIEAEGYTLGTIMKSPMEGLIDYHLRSEDCSGER